MLQFCSFQLSSKIILLFLLTDEKLFLPENVTRYAEPIDPNETFSESLSVK